MKHFVQFDQTKAKMSVALPLQGKIRESNGLNKSDRSPFSAL